MDQVVIKVRHNGPYKITGPVKLIDADEREYDIAERGETIVLCRCGRSQSKPFCDGTHKQVGFDACERAVSAERPRDAVGRPPARQP